MVQLRAKHLKETNRQLWRFNSNMVQLRAAGGIGVSTTGVSFQFQYGSIKSSIILFIRTMNAVSIPIWFN